MPTSPTPIDALPPAPNPDSDEATFDNAAWNWSVALAPFRLQLNAVASVTYSNAQEAVAAASAAAGSVTSAANQVTLATAQAGIATTKAGEAAASATAANASAGAASASATAAANSAAAAAALAGAFVGTSASSVTIGLGSKLFSTQSGELYTPGVFLIATSQGNPANFVFGPVASYNSSSGALDLTVTATGGSGTFSDWNISLAGAQGAQGPQGPVGGVNGGQMLAALDELKAPNITAAATTNVWGMVGNSATLVGATAITSFGTAAQAGAKRTLIAAGATPLTNSANLQLPGGTNYVTAAGDRLEIYAETSTQHRVSIWKANGASVSGSAMPRSVRSTNVPFTAADSGSLIEFTAGFTQTYSAGSTLGNGWWVIAKNTSGADVTHDPNGSETIDEVTSGIQKSGMDLLIEWDGTKFNVVRLDSTRFTVLHTSGTGGTLPLGVRSFKTRQTGPGGSGAKGSGSNPGPGGSCGGYSEKTWPVVASIKNYSFVIGAVGASQTTAGASGNNGGNTTFTYNGATVTTNGGPGGNAGGSSSGGAASGGDIDIPGGNGMNIVGSSYYSVTGGGPLGSPRWMIQGDAALAGVGYGTGGSGATSSQNSGAGAPSIIIVEF